MKANIGRSGCWLAVFVIGAVILLVAELIAIIGSLVL